MRWSIISVVAALGIAVTGCGSTTVTTTSATGTVVVVVTSPTSGSVIAADNVTVRGTVSPPNATVEIQGQPAAVGNGVFAGAAKLHSGKTTIDVIGSAPGLAPGSTKIVLAQQSSGGSHGHSSSGGATPAIAHETPGSNNSGTSQTSCGGGLSVGPDTTCSFAENVRASYQRNGAGTYDVYSPVTNRAYTMTCSAGAPVVCTGGNNASVYFP